MHPLGGKIMTESFVIKITLKGEDKAEKCISATMQHLLHGTSWIENIELQKVNRISNKEKLLAILAKGKQE